MSLESGDVDVQLDVREIDGEPFGDIMDALNGLDPGESLLLISDILARRERRGFHRRWNTSTVLD